MIASRMRSPEGRWVAQGALSHRNQIGDDGMKAFSDAIAGGWGLSSASASTRSETRDDCFLDPSLGRAGEMKGLISTTRSACARHVQALGCNRQGAFYGCGSVCVWESGERDGVKDACSARGIQCNL